MELLKNELIKFNAWKDRHRFDEDLTNYELEVDHYLGSCKANKKNVLNAETLLLEFAQEVQQIGLNDFDDIEKVVDVFINEKTENLH